MRKVDATFKEVDDLQGQFVEVGSLGQVDHMFEVIGLEDEDVPQYIGNSRTFTNTPLRRLTGTT